MAANLFLYMRFTLIPSQLVIDNTMRVVIRRLWLVMLMAGGVAAGCNEANPGEPVDRNASHLIFTRHARCRMDCRHIDESEVREILHNGTINYRKSEPNSHPDPKYAFEGKTRKGEDLRIVFAPSSRGVVVITVIDLDREWPCHCN